MGRFLSLVFLVFSSCLSCAGIRAPAIQVARIEVMAQETVALVQYVDENDDETTPDADGARRRPYCAGTWIDDKTILTAFHCVKDLATDPIGSPVLLAAKDDSGHFSGVVSKTDSVDDLALISADKHPAHPHASLARGAFLGDGLHILGHPGGKEWTYMHGYISQVRYDVKSPADHVTKIRVWQVSAPVWYGNSGGAAFNDAGEIVGVCSMLSTAVPNTGYFVHLDLVRAFTRA